MSQRRFIPALALVLLLGASGAVAAWNLARSAAQSPAPRAAGGVYRVLFAQPFTLDRGYAYDWRRERPMVDAGFLLVLEVDPRRVVPRQELEPVLYVGEETAERINHGADSGRVVAIVPCAKDRTGAARLDLAAAPMWFGSPALPEQVDAAIVAREFELARSAGVRAAPAGEVSAALKTGGGPRRFADRTELSRHAASVLLAWSPADRELAESMLAPLVK